MDINYAPLDFAGWHGSLGNWLVVEVDTTGPQWFVSGHPDTGRNGYFDPPSGQHSDTIKVSNCSYLRIIVRGVLPGGREDCLDINNGSHHIEVYADDWVSGGLFVATIKGGSHDITVHGRVIRGGSETDVDLGNWSDQSDERTYNVALDLSGSAKVRVRVLHAWLPLYLNGEENYRRCDWFKGVFWQVYRVLKRWGWA